MTITADYQLELADADGSVLLGDTTNYLVRSVDGLGTPPVRASESPRPRDHGHWVGADYMDSRTVTIELTVVGATAAVTLENLAALKRLFVPTADPAVRKTLAVQLPGEPAKQLVGRTRRLDADLSQVQFKSVPVVCEFFANDPQLVSVEQHSQTLVPVAASVTGRTYDRTYNVTYGGTYVDGSATVTNVGNVPARPVMVLWGPLTSPRVENTTTGETFELALPIEAGELVVVDSDARTVLLGGTTSRYWAVTARSSWWQLRPGSQQVRLFDTAGSTTGSATIVWRDTWI